MIKHVLTLLSLAIASLTYAAAPITGSLTTDYVSHYTFRGYQLASASLQPTATVQYGAFYGTAWANQSFAGGANEVDVTFGVGGAGGLDAGITAYTYPKGGKTSWEPYVGLSRDLGEYAKAGASAFYDITLKTYTFEGKGSVKVPLLKRMETSLDGSVGNSHGRDLASYTYLSAGPTLRFKLSEKAALSASAQYVWAQDGSNLWTGRGGFTVSF